MIYMCIVEVSKDNLYDSDYKNILLCDNKQVLEDKISKDKKHPMTTTKWTDVVELGENMDDCVKELVDKLLEVNYKIVYAGYLYQGPEEGNIYKIGVKIKG